MGDTYMQNGYCVPPEPTDIKEKALKESSRWGFIDRKSVIKLYTMSAQALPKYLWNYWKYKLKEDNLSWQVFLRIFSACDNAVVEWVDSKITWEELVKTVIKIIEKAKKGSYPLWPP